MLDYGKCLVALTTGQICTEPTDIPEVTTHGNIIDMSTEVTTHGDIIDKCSPNDMSSPKTPITDFFKLPKVCVAPFTNRIPTNTDFKHTDEEMSTRNRINTPYFPLFPCKDLEKTFSQPKYNALHRRRNAIACVNDCSSKIKHCENKRALLNNNTTRKCKKSVANGLLFSSEAVVGVSSVDLHNPCRAETNNTNNNNEDILKSVINNNIEDVTITKRQRRTKRRSDDILTRRIMELREENKFAYTDVQSVSLGCGTAVKPVSLHKRGIDVKTKRKTTGRSYSGSDSSELTSRSSSGSTSSGSSSRGSSIGSVGRLKELKNVETMRRKRATTLPTELSTSSTSGMNKDVLLRRRNAIAPYSATY